MKPKLHFTAPYHWINDPNGLIYYKGNYHIFYQHFPYDNKWGTMHWGHAITKDFVNFAHLPIALYPSKDFDRNGCFSGSAIEIDGQLYLYYTAIKYAKENPSNVHNQYSDDDLRASQALVVSSDGIHFDNVKNKKQIIPMIQEAYLGDYRHTRDPKIWKENDGYYMVVGNKTDQGVPQVVLFHSEDAIKWNYVSVLASDRDGTLGTMWECPDFFCLDEEYILITSPQDLCATEEFHNGNNSVYYMGKYDKKQHVFHYERVYSLDDGFDFYAPQTMLAPDGRRIMIGWMQSWDSNIRPADQKWSCMMTVPRELHIEQGRILQNPVREIENYHRNAVYYQNKEISGNCQMEDIHGRVLDMTVEIVRGDFHQFTISFAQNERYHTDFTIQKDSKMIEMNRTYSGMVRDAAAIRKSKIKTSTDKLQLRLILDKYSAEIFLNDGQQVFSSTFYTPLEADGIRFICDGKAVVNIEKYEIVVD